MADVIRLLPDAVANQIAAGEVIQRPASVVKELVENAVDAGASFIQILIRDAGKTSIQVIDNGCGMSPTDARMAFERHATSKINDARDLFAIRTLGFRGEALASIAAVAEVKLRSKRVEDELGISVEIAASQMVTQEPVACPDGTNFIIKNLFFNTPARRKFLKANTTEFRHILNEFQRIALTHPEIEFTLTHNQTELYNVPRSNFRQRIANVFGKNINQYLVPINADTSIVKISGFIGKPEAAKKSFGEQFFFVNQRFIKHPMLHRAVMKAYEQLLPSDAIPSYFIYFETDPETIDINIHPTKTEVKFEDEQSIFQILVAALRESLGKFNIVPSLDFDMDTSIGIPVLRKEDTIRPPSVDFDPTFNPFDSDSKSQGRGSYTPAGPAGFDTGNLRNWETLYQGLEQPAGRPAEQDGEDVGFPPSMASGGNDVQHVNTFQLKNKYILTPVKSGLMIIDQKRAHERILFERYMAIIQSQQGLVQRSLFPETVDFTTPEMGCLIEISGDLRALGFDLEINHDNKVQINGYPADVTAANPSELLRDIVQGCIHEDADPSRERKEKIAVQMAQSSAIPYGKYLTHEEMRELVDHLFGCEIPNFSPTGKAIIHILNMEELDKRF